MIVSLKREADKYLMAVDGPPWIPTKKGGCQVAWRTAELCGGEVRFSNLELPGWARLGESHGYQILGGSVRLVYALLDEGVMEAIGFGDPSSIPVWGQAKNNLLLAYTLAAPDVKAAIAGNALEADGEIVKALLQKAPKEHLFKEWA